MRAPCTPCAGEAPSFPRLQGRHPTAGAQPQGLLVVGPRTASADSLPADRRNRSARAPRSRAFRTSRDEHLAQQVQQACPSALRMPAVIGEDQPDDEAFIIVPGRAALGLAPGAIVSHAGSQAIRWTGPLATLGKIHPAARLVHQMLELPGQSLADLARTTLDLAPVARLYLHSLGKAPLQASQRRRIGMPCRRAHELLEQPHCVVQAHLRKVGWAGFHGRNE